MREAFVHRLPVADRLDRSPPMQAEVAAAESPPPVAAPATVPTAAAEPAPAAAAVLAAAVDRLPSQEVRAVAAEAKARIGRG